MKILAIIQRVSIPADFLKNYSKTFMENLLLNAFIVSYSMSGIEWSNYSSRWSNSVWSCRTFWWKSYNDRYAHHESGTDRCAEVAQHLDDFTHVINIQGDEPFINPRYFFVSTFAAWSKHSNRYLDFFNSWLEDLTNPNVVKVIKDRFGKALYFSRAAIPYKRDITTKQKVYYLQHLDTLEFLVFRYLLEYLNWSLAPWNKLKN